MDIQNLLFINLCVNLIVPDPANMPVVKACLSQVIYAIRYSRYVLSRNRKAHMLYELHHAVAVHCAPLPYD